MPEYKPQIDKQISDWSGAKSGDQEAPRLPDFPAARPVFAPPRKTVTAEEAQDALRREQAKPRTIRPRINYSPQ